MKKGSKIFFFITIILLLTAKLMLYMQPPNLSEPIKVIRVIDGDTIEISGNVTVRLIGIDTPESVHPDEKRNSDYGKIASAWTSDLLTGKFVQLEYDIEQTDTYGRTLAYVYLDGEMVNEILLRKGLARTMTIPPNTKYARHFQELEQEAKKNNVGLWANYYKEDTNER
ncbi:MAG: thermonuclease family protein [Lachnospiraceae bacterium]|nr:thermonuclease family protein [Lachnospiraceae bacterium]